MDNPNAALEQQEEACSNNLFNQLWNELYSQTASFDRNTDMGHHNAGKGAETAQLPVCAILGEGGHVITESSSRSLIPQAVGQQLGLAAAQLLSDRHLETALSQGAGAIFAGSDKAASAAAIPRPGEPARLQLPDGGTEIRTVDRNGSHSSVRYNRDGVATQFQDSTGTWNSADGVRWTNDKLGEWNGKVSVSADGSFVRQNSETGTETAARPDGVRTHRHADRTTTTETPLAGGGIETALSDSQGRPVGRLRTNAAGVAVYYEDNHSGVWTSQDGRHWTNPQNVAWNGTIEAHPTSGELRARSESGTTITVDSNGVRTEQYTNGNRLRVSPLAGGGHQSEVTDANGARVVTLRTNGENVPVYVQHGTAVWQSTDGRNWTVDNGPGRPRTTWRGQVGLNPQAEFTRVSENGTVTTERRDGSRLTVYRDGARMVERNGIITLFDNRGKFDGEYVAADTACASGQMPVENNPNDRGYVQNLTGRPILIAATSNQNGYKRMRYYVLHPGQTNPQNTDADGVITDPSYQPRYDRDGRLLIPSHIPPEARFYKVCNNNLCLVTGTSDGLRLHTMTDRPDAGGRQAFGGGAMPVANMTDGGPMVPDLGGPEALSHEQFESHRTRWKARTPQEQWLIALGAD